MRLVPDWRRVLARAWSVRFILLTGLLEGLAVAVPLVGPMLPIEPLWLGLAATVSTAAALVARLLAQDSIRED